MEDLTNKRFGMLEVLEFVENKPRGHRIWKCRCDCGNIVNRYEEGLRRTTHIHSCGCYTKQNLIPGDAERCRKAGKQRAKTRNVDGINIDMLNNDKNISTNTSGHKGISWSKTARKWHVFIGYKNYRCTLAFVEDIRDGVQLREKAYEAIQSGTFEDFFFQLRGFHIEEKLQQQMKNKDTKKY